MPSCMLNLRIVRGPLASVEEESILREFNRLTNSQIPLDDFRRWVRDGPGGPALHALVETDDARIVGHFSLIPLRTRFRGLDARVSRTEYLFVHEDFRKEKIRGFENSFLSAAIIVLDQLYRASRAQGWGPVIVSAGDEIRPFHKLVGCRPVDFPLVECLWILRPWAAARRTPNLSNAQRLALFSVGIAQSALFFLVRLIFPEPRDIRAVAANDIHPPANSERIGLFEDCESREWRYPDSEYTCLETGSAPEYFLIAKNGSGQRYLRVCQWHVGENATSAKQFLFVLLRQARAEKSLGVRWAVFGEHPEAVKLKSVMQHMGFLCRPRVRQLLFYTKDPKFLKSAIWDITDSLFSFDL